jgi:hypothetical protein
MLQRRRPRRRIRDVPPLLDLALHHAIDHDRDGEDGVRGREGGEKTGGVVYVRGDDFHAAMGQDCCCACVDVTCDAADGVVAGFEERGYHRAALAAIGS